ncbi:hypothetical protein ACFLTP_08010 [Chloroflexota bacterium]
MGKPTATIVTNRFEFLAKATIQNLGMPNLPLVIVPHPIGGLRPEELREIANSVIQTIMSCWLEK